MKAKLFALVWNLLFLCGSGLVLLGIGMVSRPAAVIVGGLELAVIGFLGGIGEARDWRTVEPLTGDEE